MTRVLLIAADTVGRTMAGPGIRYWEFARHLAGAADVVLAVPNVPSPAGEGFRVEPYTWHSLLPLVRRADVVVCQGFRVPLAVLQLAGRVVVIDLYDPVPLELLAFYKDAPRTEARFAQDLAAARLRRLCQRADAFLCTGERQRDFWLGALASAGRLNWDTAREDPRLERLLMVVPFGLPAAPPRPTGPAFRGVRPGIRATDRVLLWGGGVWDWLDPLTVIRAVGRVAARRDDVKLVFLGSHHPNPRIPPMRMLADAIALARSLDLYDRHVFFNDGWVPYAERQNALQEADLGLSAHLDHVEARFAFRTRLLDYFWAGLPVLCTRGDDLADLVASRGAGVVLAPGDVAGWTEAIRRLVEDPEAAARCRAGARALAGALTWEQVVAPLREFCRAPRPAPDRAGRSRLADLGAAAGHGFAVGRLAARPGGLPVIWRRWRRRRPGEARPG